MSVVYRIRYPMRTVLCEKFPRRVMDEARYSAIRDAAEDGWRPAGIAHFKVLPAAGAWSTVQVEFVAVPLEQAAQLPEPGVCVDCGQRPGWGPGAVRCRVCFAERDRTAVAAQDGGGWACGDRCGSRAGYARHREAGELACGPCRDANSAARNAARQRGRQEAR